MEKTLTPQIKVNLYALYLGSRVTLPPDPNFEDNEDEVVTGVEIDHKHSDVGYRTQYDFMFFGEEALMLTPLSSITDEHAEQAIRLYGCLSTEFGFITEQSPMSKIKKALLGVRFTPAHVCDYLRSLGYALPFTTAVNGAPQTWSVEELVKEGVVKLINK